ncbi:MAG: hypothetical protein KAT26_10650 [Marinosulfonomonas sp.]|nr:hypothetical protein [Marinosulfonomonas sp.]
MGNEAKIRIKVGSMELDYEGDPSFLNSGLEELLEKMANLVSRVPSKPDQPATLRNNNSDEKNISGSFDYSTNAIAIKYSSKSAADLVLCALIQLQLVQKKSSCSRAEIVTEMKTAKEFYKSSMNGSNLDKAFKSNLKKHKLHESGKGHYSLSSNERQDAEATLANIG